MSTETANARRELADELSQAVRRVRRYESEEKWCRVVVDAAVRFCGRAALFAVNGPRLELRAARPAIEMRGPVMVPAAPAFASAIDTKDTVVALRTRGELSAAVTAVLGEAADRRAHLFPLIAGERVVAVLYADTEGGTLEPGALDVLTTYSGMVLERIPPRQRAADLHQIGDGTALQED